MGLIKKAMDIKGKSKHATQKIKEAVAKEEIKEEIEKVLKPLDVDTKEEKDISLNHIAPLLEKNERRKAFLVDYKLCPAYNPVTRNYNFKDKVKLFFKLKWKLLLELRQQRKFAKKFPEKANLVHFFLNNGASAQFFVLQKDGGFIYDERQYSFSTKVRGNYNAQAGYWELFYHEDWALPFEIHFPIAKIRDAITDGLADEQLVEIEYATHPRTLYQFLVSKILEMIFSGGMLAEMLNKILMNGYIQLFLTAIGFIILGFMVHGQGKTIDAIATAISALSTAKP